MTWLAAESAIVARLVERGIAAQAVVSRAELRELAAATGESWSGVAVVYGGYDATTEAQGCIAQVRQRWWTYCTVWDVDGDSGARAGTSEVLVDAVLGALLGLDVPGARGTLELAPAGPADDEAASRLLPLAWNLDMIFSSED